MAVNVGILVKTLVFACFHKYIPPRKMLLSVNHPSNPVSIGGAGDKKKKPIFGRIIVKDYEVMGFARESRVGEPDYTSSL